MVPNRFFILAVLCIFWISPAQAKISLDPTKSISGLIKEFRAALESILQTASVEAQTTVAQSINNLNMFLQNAERAYAGTVGATVKDLEKIEIDAFERANSLLDNVNASLTSSLDRPLSSAEDISALVAETLAFSSKPIVTRYSPTYVPPSDRDDTVRITVEGLRLHTAEFGRPKLEIGEEVFYGSATDRTIVFDLPRSVFPSQKIKPASLQTKLILEAPSGVWTINRWMSKPQLITFGLSFVVIPDKLGDYTVSGVRVLTEVVKEDYVPVPPDPPTLTIQQGVGVRAVTHCYTPPEGFDFDLNTAKAIMVERQGAEPGGSGGKWNPAVNIGQAVLDPTQVLDRKRICLSVSAGTGCKNCSATSVGKLSVKTTKTVERREKLTETAAQLNWEPVFVDIDEKVPNQAINVSIFGLPRHPVLLDRSYSIPPFLQVEVHANRKTAIIKPIIPAR